MRLWTSTKTGLTFVANTIAIGIKQTIGLCQKAVPIAAKIAPIVIINQANIWFQNQLPQRASVDIDTTWYKTVLTYAGMGLGHGVNFIVGIIYLRKSTDLLVALAHSNSYEQHTTRDKEVAVWNHKTMMQTQKTNNRAFQDATAVLYSIHTAKLPLLEEHALATSVNESIMIKKIRFEGFAGKDFGFFKKLPPRVLDVLTHDFAQAQEAHDQQFALVPYKAT